MRGRASSSLSIRASKASSRDGWLQAVFFDAIFINKKIATQL